MDAAVPYLHRSAARTTPGATASPVPVKLMEAAGRVAPTLMKYSNAPIRSTGKSKAPGKSMQTAYKTHAASTIFPQRRNPSTAAVSSLAHPRKIGTRRARAMPRSRSSSHLPQSYWRLRRPICDGAGGSKGWKHGSTTGLGM